MFALPRSGTTALLLEGAIDLLLEATLLLEVTTVLLLEVVLVPGVMTALVVGVVLLLEVITALTSVEGEVIVTSVAGSLILIFSSATAIFASL